MHLGRASLQGGPGDVVNCWYDMQSGDKIGGQIRAPVIHLWLDRGSGWEWVYAEYRTVNIETGTHFGMSTQGDSATRLDDFGWCIEECGFTIVSMNWRSSDRQSSARRVLTGR